MSTSAASIVSDETGPIDGQVVVLVHGSMDRAGGFLRVVRHLPHYRVVRYDRRGYGRSRPHPGPFDMASQVDDLVAVLAGRRAVMVGHSYGGNVALALADRRPDLVTAVGAFEPPLPWLDWWPSNTAGGQAVADGDGRSDGDTAERFLRRMIGDERWEALPGAMRVDRRDEGTALVGELTDLHEAPPWSPGAVRAPLVVGRGGSGARHHAQSATWVVEQIPGSELVVIDGAPHGAHLSHGEAFAAEFVERVVARAGAVPATPPS